MRPKVCFYAPSPTGSFQVRGVQLADQRAEWWATLRLSPTDIMRADVVVFVKVDQRRKMRLLRALGKVVVYDILDCWRQPEDGLAYPDLASIRGYFAARFRGLPADAVVYPNQTMQDDLADLFPPGVVLYHHYREGLRPIEVKPVARTVAYEGDTRYLGPWRPALEDACRALSLRLVLNPASLREADIVFAGRGGEHASLMACRYKSNVKLANCFGAGIPAVISTTDCAYAETAPPSARRCEGPQDVEAALRSLLPRAARQAAQDDLLAGRAAFDLSTLAAAYADYFERLAQRRASA